PMTSFAICNASLPATATPTTKHHYFTADINNKIPPSVTTINLLPAIATLMVKFQGNDESSPPTAQTI
ncbi:27905_t:CDS:2, partial [Dentiscutata erythropus]